MQIFETTLFQNNIGWLFALHIKVTPNKIFCLVHRYTVTFSQTVANTGHIFKLQYFVQQPLVSIIEPRTLIFCSFDSDIRGIKLHATWSYRPKRQTAKMTSEFVFFSSNPSLNHIKIEKCLLLFTTNTNIFTLLFKELKTDGKSFIFALPFDVTPRNVKLNLSIIIWLTDTYMTSAYLFASLYIVRADLRRSNTVSGYPLFVLSDFRLLFQRIVRWIKTVDRSGIGKSKACNGMHACIL